MEKRNNYTYFKTDTDFDSGSSGGTVLNEAGEFIGIPTYIRSNNETVGYFLDLSNARTWIDEHLKQAPQNDSATIQLLKNDLYRLSKANADLTYTQDHYPYFKANAPEGWKFLYIRNDRFILYEKNVSDPVGVAVFTLENPYEVDEGVMDELNRKFGRLAPALHRL
ncbi:hypothetical protein IPJ72_05555 [Candidatus Peregrinibacteria bacterium]|nr:MAG: hypothetical protein IPJ72_05555 [Candidatus Peregrinibacteria bacterium]